MQARRIRVAYVAGTGRSGSTLLGRMLGQGEGCAPVGEMVRVWKRGVGKNLVCSCGAAFRDCELWGPVGRAAFGGWDTLDAADLVRLQRSVDRVRYVPLYFLPIAPRKFRQRLERYLDLVRPLYAAVAEVTGNDVVVDVSKRVSTLLLLRRARTFDVRVVHLVRDVRGVAYSWTKEVRKPDVEERAQYMDQFHPAATALRYVLDNLVVHAASLLGIPTAFVRYEDVVTQPRTELTRLLAFVGAPQQELTFVKDDAVELHAVHSIGGNPNRFATGLVALRPDEEWRAKLGRASRSVVTWLTAPLLLRYGYVGRRR